MNRYSDGYNNDKYYEPEDDELTDEEREEQECELDESDFIDEDDWHDDQLLDYSYTAPYLCILYRNKRMKTEYFIYYLLGFVVVYLSIQIVLAYFGGRL